jgi:hypothetical protein
VLSPWALQPLDAIGELFELALELVYSVIVVSHTCYIA